jgi:hypothetical protein
MTHLLSLDHFLAHDQIIEDYKNLTFHYEDFKSSHKHTNHRNISAKNCKKYLNRIIENKTLLLYDTAHDRRLLNEIIITS